MKSIRLALAGAWFSAALLLLIYYATTQVTFSIEFLYRNAAGLSTAQSIARIAAWLASLSLFMAGAIVAIPTALTPAPWLRKWLHILPGYVLLFLLAGVVATLLNLGTIGAFYQSRATGPITFSMGWLALAGVLTAIVVAIVIARVDLNARTIKATMVTTGIAFVFSLVVVVGMLWVLNIISSTPPRVPSLGAEGAPSGSPAQPGGPGQPGAPGGQEGGGLPDVRSLYQNGTLLAAVFGILALASSVAAARMPRIGGTEPLLRADWRQGAVQAVISAATLSVVILLVIQVVPVQRTNPPVQATINWDSAQTQQLWNRTCATCHTSETQWPWYAYIAPASWLTVGHVNAGRQQVNLSNTIPPIRRARMARDLGEQIKEGRMPPTDYLLMHPEARLTEAEKQQLIQGLQNSLK